MRECPKNQIRTHDSKISFTNLCPPVLPGTHGADGS
jgi:hypothetical protein